MLYICMLAYQVMLYKTRYAYQIRGNWFKWPRGLTLKQIDSVENAAGLNQNRRDASRDARREVGGWGWNITS